ncbi:hypothetical protein [Kribbella sp. NPDC004536]|uniref:hypothetical protein n=1 Tax=Kribbella sp. NPDC004536 TaxID=3364106 RepID=UPI003679D8AF
MTTFGLVISAGVEIEAEHAFVIDDPDAYICTRMAASTDPGDCEGLITPGEPHMVVTINGRPLLRWCRACAPGIVGRAFATWLAS